MNAPAAIATALILISTQPTLAYCADESPSSQTSDGITTIEIDVRTKDEYDAGHLKGATWIERGILEFTLARTIRDPQAEIVIYCKKGNRSGLAVKALRQMGYQNVRAHVGFDAWVEAGLSFYNYLGEAKIVHLREMNAASYPVEYYAEKK